MKLAAGVAVLTMLALSAGCQSQSSQPTAPGTGKSAALRNMEQVAIAAHRCWFASGDPTFRDYSFANELNSFSGRPRFLLVPKGNFGGKPLLVVQAEGSAGAVTTFGPLLEKADGQRIAGDVRRWSGGDSACA